MTREREIIAAIRAKHPELESIRPMTSRDAAPPQPKCLCRGFFPAKSDRQNCPIHKGPIPGMPYWNGAEMRWQESPVYPSQRPDSPAQPSQPTDPHWGGFPDGATPTCERRDLTDEWDKRQPAPTAMTDEIRPCGAREWLKNRAPKMYHFEEFAEMLEAYAVARDATRCQDCANRWSASLEGDGPEYQPCPKHAAAQPSPDEIRPCGGGPVEQVIDWLDEEYPNWRECAPLSMVVSWPEIIAAYAAHERAALKEAWDRDLRDDEIRYAELERQLAEAEANIERWTDAWFVGETIVPDGSVRPTLQGLIDRTTTAETRATELAKALGLLMKTVQKGDEGWTLLDQLNFTKAYAKAEAALASQPRTGESENKAESPKEGRCSH